MQKSYLQTGVKKLFSVLIALLATFAITVPAYATSTPAGTAVASAAAAGSTATIEAKTGNAGDTLNMYKVVNVTYANNQLTYAWSDTFTAFQASADGAAYSTLTVDQYTSMDAATAKALLGAFSAWVHKTAPAYAYTAQTGAAGTPTEGVATFTGVGLGQYIIVGMGNVSGAYIYSTVTAEVVPHIDNATTPPSYKIYDKYEVDLKTTKPDGEKEITSGTTPDGEVPNTKPTASIGDVVGFRLTGDVPTYPAGTTNKTLFMADTLPTGLTLNPASVKVYMGTDVNNKTPLSGTDPDKAYTLTVDGQTLYVDYLYDKLTPGQKLFVEYEATLNEQAVIGGAGNSNDYTYTYSNNPFNGETHEHDNIPDDDHGYGEVEDEETVYSYGLYIYKTAKTATGTALQGAKFELWANEVGGTTGKLIATLTTDENGYAAYNGLEKGTYVLHEIEAPTGYKLADDVTIDLSNASATASTTTTTSTRYTSDPTQAVSTAQATNADGVLLWLPKPSSGLTGLVASATNPDANKYEAAYLLSTTNTVTGTPTTGAGAGAGYYPQNVIDMPGSNLPTTGGMGTFLLYGIGIVLVAGAAVLYMRKRQSANQA